MAKKRTLKKDIGYIAGELFTEVLVAKMLIPGIDHEKADALMGRILDMQDSFTLRAGNPDGKDNPKRVKEYYKRLGADLRKEIATIITEIEALGKENKA